MLKKTLLTNVLFSFFSALVILFGNKWLDKHIPLPGWMWVVMGIGLLCFAGFLVLMLKNKKLQLSSTLSIVISDLVWVVTTTIAAVIYIAALSGTGIVLIFVVNLIVGALACFQYFGYRRITVDTN